MSQDVQRIEAHKGFSGWTIPDRFSIYLIFRNEVNSCAENVKKGQNGGKVKLT